MLADDWTSLRDVQYRKVHLYDLDWAGKEDRQLDRCLVAVAKYGGAVAMVRDETKLLKVRTGRCVTKCVWSCCCAVDTYVARLRQQPATAVYVQRLRSS